MGRYSPSRSYGHRIQRIAGGDYFISWTFDRYITGSRLRWPTRHKRFTNEAGARRFAKRHGINFPES